MPDGVTYALWAEDSDGYMTVEELDEIVQMIVRAICSRKKTERICGQDFPREVIKENAETRSVDFAVERDFGF